MNFFNMYSGVCDLEISVWYAKLYCYSTLRVPSFLQHPIITVGVPIVRLLLASLQASVRATSAWASQ